MNKINIFLLSLIISITFLSIERLIGIGWDYHQDSITYHLESQNIYNELNARGVLAWINGGYYFIVHMLGSNIYLVTAFNIIAYSINNVLFYTEIKKNAIKGVFIYLTYLIILNPYRIHLSTTMLKDTLIILIFSLIYIKRKKMQSLFGIIMLIFVRVVGSLYIMVLIDKRKFIYLISLIGLLLISLWPEILISRLDESDAVDLNSRAFDTIPTFQEYSYFGSLLRFITWPFLALTGAYVFISPAPAFIAVALGSYMIIYFSIINKINIFDIRIYVIMGIFAVLAPGFTSYIRYVYPLIIISPFLILNTRSEKINLNLDLLNKTKK